MASIQLPYFAASEILPSALPTTEAIENSQDMLSESSGRKIVRVGCHFVVKYGSCVTLIECENMLFVSQSTKIRVPRVYAIYSSSQTGANYIVMENIVADTLDSRWRSLSTAQKEKICTQLRHICDQLRSIPSSGYFGSLGKRGLEDPVFWTGNEIRSGLIGGPFETEDELNDAMIQKYLYNNLPAQKAEFYRSAFPIVLKDHQPVFTHCDFQRKNILVRDVGDGYSLIIIDWEASGWYPSYWEFANAMFACGRWEDDWSFWVYKF
ncbi:uncharacterized protein PAC_19478 [Phialocephala subalpina]|uniref:Aminoglycoside phosphotransferase domain-containing protein n=1 Tax=Phialocephala subalpina TaxID=576137 RepID=A0A1L7XX45_9HELO|nr:uncharacterized protein PAC_19478 [Phialocephala subalpina]